MQSGAMPVNTTYEDSMVRYFAEVLASKTDMSFGHAKEAVQECIRDELKTSAARGLVELNVPMGQLMLGRQSPPSATLANYVRQVRAAETARWARNRVTDQDIIDWWDLGAVVHGAYVAFDSLFNGAVVIDAMQHNDNCESVEELADYGHLSLRKRFPLYGPANSDDGTEDGRLPHELRARVEAWTAPVRREAPDSLLEAIMSFDTYNAMCRNMIRSGVF
jgi:hypothetical protein